MTAGLNIGGMALDDLQMEDRVFRRTARRLVPIIVVSFLIALIDRNNLSFASLSMNADLQFSQTIYGIGVAAFYCGYSLFEVPSNLLLARFGARRWLARIMFTWGLLSMAMAVIQLPWQFYVLRFLLGVAEAGFYPGIAHYISSWMPARRRGRAISLIYVSVPLSSVLTGALAAPLLQMNGLAGLAGWQWIFLVEGAPALIMAVMLLVLLPDSPDAVRWLSVDEKAWLKDRLERDALASGPVRHSLWATLTDPVVLLVGLAAALNFASAAAILFSGPKILVSRLHFTLAEAGWVTISCGVLAMPVMLVIGRLADRVAQPFALKIGLLCLGAVGVLIIRLAGDNAALLIAGYLLFYVAGQVASMFLAILVSRFVHPSGRAAGLAMANTLAQSGAFAGPILWGIAADATGGFDSGLSAAIGTMLLAAMAASLASVSRRPTINMPVSKA